MTLSAENKAYLDEFRDRIKKKHPTYSEEELLKLSSVYGQVLEFSGIKGGGKIDKSCSACIMETVKILFNYIRYHEPVVPVHRATIVKEVKPTGSSDHLSPSEKEQVLKIYNSIPEHETTVDEAFKSIKDAGIQEPADHLGAIHEAHKTVADPHSKVPDFKHTPEPPVKKTRRPRTVKPKTK